MSASQCMVSSCVCMPVVVKGWRLSGTSYRHMLGVGKTGLCMIFESTLWQAEAEDLRAKLEDSWKQAKSDQQMISWLNSQVCLLALVIVAFQ